MILNIKLSQPLTWDEVAEEYHKLTGGRARILPMNTVFEALASNTDKYFVDPVEGTIHRIEGKEVANE